MKQLLDGGLDVERIRVYLEEVVSHYTKTAPTVSTWADDLYMRLAESPERVTVKELIMVGRLYDDDGWQLANYAANTAYKCAAVDKTGWIDH